MAFTTEQVAAYIRDQNLTTKAQLDEAAKVFGVSAAQMNMAKLLLSSGNTSGVDSASNAYAAAVTPAQEAQNLAFYNPAAHSGTAVAPLNTAYNAGFSGISVPEAINSIANSNPGQYLTQEQITANYENAAANGGLKAIAALGNDPKTLATETLNNQIRAGYNDQTANLGFGQSTAQTVTPANRVTASVTPIAPTTFAPVTNIGIGSTNTSTSTSGGTSNQFNVNDPAHAAAARQLMDAVQQMIANGNEAKAKALYNSKQQQFGFSDANISPFTANMGVAGAGGFGADQINSWKAPQPVSVAIPAQQTYNASQATQANPTVAAQSQTAQAAPTERAVVRDAQVAQNGSTALAGSQGYNASNVNLGMTYGGMGGSDPSAANARLLSGQVDNPYLSQQAQSLTGLSNQNLMQNVLPGIGQGAALAGQYGGSRQGIAQGVAIGNTQTGLNNSIANLYGNAYQQAQQNMSTAAGQLSSIGAQTGIANAGYQNQAAQFGANAANNASQYNAGATNQNNQFNTAATNTANLYNAGQTNAVNMFNSGQNNANNQFNAGQSNQVGMYNTGQQNNYNLGMTNANNNATAMKNSYDLGLRSNDLGYANLDANIYNSNFNNQLAGANFGLNAYSALNTNNNNGLNAANTVQNQPLNYYGQFSGAADAAGNGGTQATTQMPGSPVAGALAGAQLYNAYNNYNPAVSGVANYNLGLGSSYGGAANDAGLFTPYRSGM